MTGGSTSRSISLQKVNSEMVVEEVDRLQNGLEAELLRMEEKLLEKTEEVQAQLDGAEENDLSMERQEELRMSRQLNLNFEEERDNLETEDSGPD